MKRRGFLAAGLSAMGLSSVSAGCLDSVTGGCGPGEDTIEDAYQYQAIEIPTTPDRSNPGSWTEAYANYEDNEVTVEGEIISVEQGDDGKEYTFEDSTGTAVLYNGGLSPTVTVAQYLYDTSYEPDETQAEEGECIRVTGVPSVTSDQESEIIQFHYPRIIEIIG